MKNWQTIASEVLGTKLDLKEIADKYEVKEEDVAGELDAQGVEECANCGKWADASDLDGDYYCEECTAEEDEEDGA